MARIRSIKPDFWTDDTITECSLSARLLFIGIWNFADDAGNLDRSPKQIKARVFPVDNIDCEPLLRELITHGLLIEYSVSGQKYLHIPGFAKHQLINRPSKPVVPKYEDSLRTHGTLSEPSRTTHAGLEGIGGEGVVVAGDAPHSAGNGNPEPPAQAPTDEDQPPALERPGTEQPAPRARADSPSRGTRIPDGYQPDLAFARATIPDIDAEAEAAKFRDFWLAKPGKDGTKLNWDATWRNWIRNAMSDGRYVRRRVTAAADPAAIHAGLDMR